MQSIQKFEEKIMQYVSPFNWGEMRKEVYINSYSNEKMVVVFVDHIQTAMHYRVLFEFEKDNTILVSDYFESKKGQSSTLRMSETELNSLNNIRSKVKIMLTMAVKDIFEDVEEEFIFTSWSDSLPLSYKELKPFDVIKNGSKRYYIFNVDKSANKDFYYERKKHLIDMDKLKYEQPDNKSIIVGFEYSPFFVHKLQNKNDGKYIFEFENGHFLE